MAKLAEVKQRRLWKLNGLDRRHVYSTLNNTPGVVCVLENGSRVVHREKVTRNDDARYKIENGWLIEETYPAGVQRQRQQMAARKTASQARRKANAAATRAPAFQAVLRELDAGLGAPTRVRALDVTLWAYPKPRTDKQCFAWMDRVRAAAGAATIYTDWTGSQLRVVSGRMSRLGALFGPQAWWGNGLGDVLDALDDDAGLQIDFVEYEGDSFEIALDRVPRAVDKHAKALGAVFNWKPRAVAAALRARVWRGGN